MEAAIKTAVTQVLHAAPLAMWRRIFPKTAIGVCYHIVSDQRVPHVRHYPVLDEAGFEADLDYLQRKFGFTSHDELAQRRNAGSVEYDSAVLLTFDDGFAECARVVAPILQRRGIGCVFFVITDLIDNATVFRETEASLCVDAVSGKSADEIAALMDDLGLRSRLRPVPQPAPFDMTRHPLEIAGLGGRPDPGLRALLHWLLTVRADEAALLRRLSARLGVDAEGYVRTARPYLTGDQIMQLRSCGFTIGAHSCSHRRLQELSREEAEREIVESCRKICELTGQVSAPFAFPYSGYGMDRAWLAQLRRKHEFIGLFFDTGGLREDEPFVVQRVFGERIGHDATLDGVLRRAWAKPSAWRVPRRPGARPA